MAVREFDGVDDQVVTAVGALSGMTFGTIAFIVKRTGPGSWDAVFSPHTSGGTFRGEVGINNGTQWFWAPDSGTVSNQGTVSNNVWYLVVVRKATGSVAPRFSVLNMGSGTWAHGAGSNNQANWTSPGVGGTIRMSFESTDDFPLVRLAARAAWSNSLPWAANATGDAAIEAAGLHTSAQAWVDAAPSAFWLFDQASTGTAVEDLTGGGADQTAITGTTVITDDDPPGFDFDLGGAVNDGSLAGSLPALAGSVAATASDTAAINGDLPTLAGSMTAAVSGTASVDGQLPSLGGNVAAAATDAGALHTTLPVLTASVAGEASADGDATMALPEMTGTLSGMAGTAVAGTLAAAMPPLAGSVTAAASDDAALATTLPPLAASLTGVAGAAVAGTLGGTLPGLAGALSSFAEADATLAGGLPPLTGLLVAGGGPQLPIAAPAALADTTAYAAVADSTRYPSMQDSTRYPSIQDTTATATVATTAGA